MTQFLKFLQKYCTEKQLENSKFSMDELFCKEIGRMEAYMDIKKYIISFLQDHAEEKILTKIAEENFLKSIEESARKQFDDPVELISHIGKISSRPPFFDSERISMSAINAFCNDFLNQNRVSIRNELLKDATF